LNDRQWVHLLLDLLLTRVCTQTLRLYNSLSPSDGAQEGEAVNYSHSSLSLARSLTLMGLCFFIFAVKFIRKHCLNLVWNCTILYQVTHLSISRGRNLPCSTQTNKQRRPAITFM
ncbi:hypothetical protein PO909_020329, partial [Leuciscus waleckii]